MLGIPAQTALVGEAGIGNDTMVVFCGEPVQFGIYAWLVGVPVEG